MTALNQRVLLYHAFPSHVLLETTIQGETKKRMKNMILKSMTRLYEDESGQGLVEYALIIALVAFAAVIAMQTLAKDINNAFVGIGSILSSYVP